MDEGKENQNVQALRLHLGTQNTESQSMPRMQITGME